MTNGNRCGDPDGERAESERDHLADVPDGAGCVEIWERISDTRETDE